METNRIYNMDCLEGIKKIETGSVKLVATDPPYFQGFTHNGQKGAFNDLAISRPFFAQLAQEFARVLSGDGEFYIFLRLARVCVLLPDICRLPTCAKYDCLGQNERCRELLPKYARTDDLWGCKFADNQTRNERMDGKGVFFRRARFGWRKSTSNAKATWNYAADHNQ